MATEARCQVPRTPGALAVPTSSGATLTPKELAEFIDSLEEDVTDQEMFQHGTVAFASLEQLCCAPKVRHAI